jgi:hypothetical protein
MKNIEFIVGKTITGFDAYREENGKIVAVTTGTNLGELKANILESYNLYQEYNGKKKITPEQVGITFDVPSFFEYYDIISAKALSARIGMNNALLSHYIKGIKKPSHKQVEKILAGIKDVGRELMELEIK